MDCDKGKINHSFEDRDDIVLLLDQISGMGGTTERLNRIELEKKNEKWHKLKKYGPFALLFFLLFGIYWRLPDIVAHFASQYNLEYSINNIESISQDHLGAEILVKRVPNSFWPLTIYFTNSEIFYEGNRLATCEIPPIAINWYTQSTRLIKVRVNINDPSVIASVLKDFLVKDQTMKIDAKFKLKVKPDYFFSLPSFAFERSIDVPQVPFEVPKDKLLDLFDIVDTSHDSITAQVNLPPIIFGETKVSIVKALVILVSHQVSVCQLSILPQRLDLSKTNKIKVLIEPINQIEFSQMVSKLVNGELVKVSFVIDKNRSDPFIAQFSDHLKDIIIPIKMEAMSTIEEVQLIRIPGQWTPMGAVLLTNPFSADIKLLSLVKCKVWKNGKLFATIEEPNINPPVLIPARAEHFRVDQSMEGKFEGSMFDIIRTVKELLTGDGTAYVDVQGELTLMLGEYKVTIGNSQKDIPIRIHKNDTNGQAEMAEVERLLGIAI
jgi:hypothetical protein